VSAVCTHPDARRRGLAAALTMALARRFAEAGDQSFLHVAEDNVGARRVYDALGFTERRAMTFAVLTAPGTPS
jgi:predicted GNAT family acetyltransferase